jgi:hypothetical protein
MDHLQNAVIADFAVKVSVVVELASSSLDSDICPVPFQSSAYIQNRQL